jgi:hypothetical protein
MILFLISLLAEVPSVQIREPSFPNREYTQTKDGRDVMWVSDVRTPIVRMEIAFSQGVKGCSTSIEQAWRDQVQQQERALRNIEGIVRFSMRENQGFLEVAVPKGTEKKGLRLLRKIVQNATIREVERGVLVQQNDWSHSDVIRQTLFGAMEKEEREERVCRAAYRAWLRESTPQFLFVGPMEMKAILSSLDFFWPQYNIQHDASISRDRDHTQQDIPHISSHTLYDIDMSGQIQMGVFFTVPSHISWDILEVYKDILGGSFTGRLLTSLRERHGWVYSMSMAIHTRGSERIMEISTQCSISNVILVREELIRLIKSMTTITNEERIRVRMKRIRKLRVMIFDGVQQIDHVRNVRRFDDWERTEKNRSIVSKEDVEQCAQDIVDEISFLWIVRGSKREIEDIWSAEWRLFIP